jgi:alpha/beta superfamily hydrolase
MNSQTQRSTVAGPAGAIEVARDPAQGISRGLAFVSHPHPLFGGTLDNKVVQTLARAFNQSGWETVRYNFRGVGESAGSHDGGRGELEDLLSLIDTLQPQGPLCLAGFSFGAFITGCACARLHEQRDIAKLVLVGTAAGRFEVAPIPQALHERTLVVHGESDDTVPLTAVMDWARPQVLPVLVIPGGGHFFHGQLPLLKNLVVRHLSA